MWVTDLSAEPPTVEPLEPPGRRGHPRRPPYRYDLSDGEAESFLVEVIGRQDLEEGTVDTNEYEYRFGIDWVCGGYEGSVPLPGRGVLLWHPDA
ncbi:hypothetical protein NORO109296_25720 [Nocardiopsis rhodophaea]